MHYKLQQSGHEDLETIIAENEKIKSELSNQTVELNALKTKVEKDEKWKRDYLMMFTKYQSFFNA